MASGSHTNRDPALQASPGCRLVGKEVLTCLESRCGRRRRMRAHLLLRAGPGGLRPPLRQWHSPPFWDSISFLACSRMLLMASSEPVSGVRILGVILPGGGKGASVVGTCMLRVNLWSWAGRRVGPLLPQGLQGQGWETLSVCGKTTT